MNVSFVERRYDEVKNDICGILFGGVAQITWALWLLGLSLELVAILAHLLVVRLRGFCMKIAIDTDDSHATCEVFYSMSRPCLSPWRPTLRIFHWRGETNELRHLLLHATHEYKRWYVFCLWWFNAHSDVVAWKLSLYRMHSSDRPLVRLGPRLIEVEQVIGIPAKVWGNIEHIGGREGCADGGLDGLTDSDGDVDIDKKSDSVGGDPRVSHCAGGDSCNRQPRQ